MLSWYITTRVRLNKYGWQERPAHNDNDGCLCIIDCLRTGVHHDWWWTRLKFYGSCCCTGLSWKYQQISQSLRSRWRWRNVRLRVALVIIQKEAETNNVPYGPINLLGDFVLGAGFWCLPIVPSSIFLDMQPPGLSSPQHCGAQICQWDVTQQLVINDTTAQLLWQRSKPSALFHSQNSLHRLKVSSLY